MNWLLDRLKERSSWLAIFTVIGLIGIKIDPELREVIINAILAVAAVAAFVFKEPGDTRAVRNDLPSDSAVVDRVSQDYLPKEPANPVDNGWNG